MGVPAYAGTDRAEVAAPRPSRAFPVWWPGDASAEWTLDLYRHHLGSDADRAGIARVNHVLGAKRKPRPTAAHERGSRTDGAAR